MYTPATQRKFRITAAALSLAIALCTTFNYYSVFFQSDRSFYLSNFLSSGLVVLGALTLLTGMLLRNTILCEIGSAIEIVNAIRGVWLLLKTAILLKEVAFYLPYVFTNLFLILSWGLVLLAFFLPRNCVILGILAGSVSALKFLLTVIFALIRHTGLFGSFFSTLNNMVLIPLGFFLAVSSISLIRNRTV